MKKQRLGVTNSLFLAAMGTLLGSPASRNIMPSVRSFKSKLPDAELQTKAEAKRARKNAKRAKDHHHE